MHKAQGTLALRFPLVVCFFLAAFSARATNTLLLPNSHRQVLLEGATALLQAGDQTGLQVQGDSLALAPGVTDGRLRVSVSFPGAKELIPSWNGTAPGNSGFRVMMRVTRGSTKGEWFEAGSWGNTPLPQTRNYELPEGSYDQDYLKLKSACTGADFEVQLLRAAAGDASPTFRLLSLSTAAGPGLIRLPGNLSNYGAVSGDPIQSGASFVPQVMVGRSDWVERTCSPAAVSMSLAAFGVPSTVKDLAARTFDKPADAFGVWNRAVMSGAERGLRGYVTRFSNWGEVHAALKRGAAICASIRMKPGEVQDPLTKFNRRLKGTKGHIVSIKGIQADGSIIVNDPASKDYGGNSVWTAKDLGTAWFEKGGVAYVFERR